MYDLPFPLAVDYNAKRLAVTSINHAAWSATLIAAQDNPFADYLHWELSAGHVIYDICDAYAKHDEGLGLGNYPLDAAPLPHPFCTCLWYVDTAKTLDQIAKELTEWESGVRYPALDRSFGKWNNENGYIERKVELPDGDYAELTEGTRLEKKEVIAGKGRERKIDELDYLMYNFGGDETEWTKQKAFGYVDYYGESCKAEIHWYENPIVGSVKRKVKTHGGDWILPGYR